MSDKGETPDPTRDEVKPIVPADGPLEANPALAAPVVRRRRHWLPSIIWLIPIVAAVIGITLVARVLREQGPEIVLTFSTAEGLEAGKTAVRYKEVQIGLVTRIRLARDLSNVRVLVQLNKDAEAFTAEDSRYWVVRPRLDTSGISGLGTLLSGAYIGADPGVFEAKTDEFEGLESPPIVTRDSDGRQFLLRAQDIGSLDIGSPVYFRRLKVGKVSTFELDQEGRSINVRVFVDAAYQQYVGVNTRFWHASGIDVDINAGGVKLRTQSIASIVLGGIAFGSPDDERGPPADENAIFALAADEATAMKPPDGPALSLLLDFDQSVRGLSPGAPVDFRGINVGEVKSIGVQLDRAKGAVRLPVLVQIYPERLHRISNNRGPQSRADQLEVLQLLIDKGLRAQLRSGNLLTGQLYVALDFFPKLTTVKVDTSQSPIELPTVPGSLDEIQTQVQEIASKLNKVPYEEIAKDLRTTLATLNRTLGSADQVMRKVDKEMAPEVTAALKELRKTLASADRTLAQDSPLQQDLRETLQELTRAAGSIRVLTDYLERHPESLLRGKPDDRR
ncbi:MAG: MlaD family protein [Variovorax sp.]